MIGATTSQTLDLTLINKGDTIYGTSTIKLEIGLKIGSTIEYIPIGIYNIDDVEKNDFTIKITAYDNMIKFERNFVTTLGDTLTLQQVVNELARITGVEFTGSLPSYTVKKLEGFSCRDVLGYVASICGGNAVITRDGKFTIVTPADANYSIETANYFDYKREEVKYKIGKISCQIGEEVLSKSSLGTDSMELEFENPWINETILTNIYNKLNGFEYLGYSMKWQGDLSLDVGDIITITDKKGVVRKHPILSQKFTYTGGLTSEIGAKGETKNKNSFSSSGSTAKKVDRVVAELLIVNEALIEKANIQDLEAVSIKTQTLEAKTATIEEAIINVAHIEDLNAINAIIENLKVVDLAAINAKITNLQADKANITDLTATNIKFNVGSGGTLDLQTLLSKHITGENGQFINISSSNTVIANAVIKDAMIENISVNKLLAGTISTNKFTVASDDGGIQIVGPTMQFKDKNNKVRIQMGQDTQGSFNFILRGEDGTTTLIDHTGIKEKAIADDLIKSNMVASDAIGEKQINYSSFITGLNKDDNTSLIKASKVAIDLTGQSLEVSFNSLKSNVDNIEIGGRNLILTSNDEKTYDKDGGIVVSKNGNFIKVLKNTSITNSNLGVWKDVVVEPNTEYTVSLKVGHSDRGRIGIGSFISGNNQWSQYGYFDFTANQLFIKTFTTKSEETKVRLFIAINAAAPIDSYLEFINVKFEKGNKATDWTPAPEDVDSKIESNTTLITVAQGKIEGLISENTIIKDEVTTISDKYTSLKATVDGINTTVASHTSSITTIKNTADSALSNANNANSKIDGLQVGGRNLILNSNFLNDTKNWTPDNLTISIVDDSVYSKALKVTNSNNNRIYQVLNNVWKANQVYTVSFYAKSSTSGGTIVASRSLIDYGATQTLTTEWKRYSCTITSNATVEGGTLSLSFSNADTIYITRIQLETGNKPTDWKPALEDVDSSINEVDTKVTTVENKYTELSQSLDGFKLTVANTYSTKTELSGVDGKVTSLTSRISTAESSITQLNNKIALKVEATDVTEAINDIQVGGRNLLLNSNNENSYAKDNDIIVVKSGNWIKLTKNTNINLWNLGIWKDISVKENSLYTISLRCGNSIGGVLGVGSFIPDNNIWWEYGSFTLNSNSYFTKTITTKSNEVKIRVFIAIRSSALIDSYLEFIDIKVEEGNKATSWTPAPEDVESSIFTVSNKVATIETNLNSITSRVSDAETSITTVDGKVTDLTSRMSTAEQKITSDAIVSTVTSSTSWSTVSNNASNALTNANNANNKIDGLQIGGRNLAQQTDFKKDAPKWFCANGATIDKSTGKATLISNGKDCHIGHTLAQRLEPNTTYTLSARFKDNNTVGGNGLRLYILINGNWQHKSVPSNIDGVYSFTFTTPNSITQDSQITIDSHTTISGSCEVWNVKLEKGNKATDWTSAPEDVENIITSLEERVNTAEQSITPTAIVSTVTSSTTYKNDLNGKASTTYVQSLEEKVTATGITTTISESINNGTTSIITTQFVMDKKGLTIKNGALEVQDNTGRVVLKGTTAGNLLLRGDYIKIKDDLTTSAGEGMVLTRKGLSFTGSDGGTVSFNYFGDECLTITGTAGTTKRKLYIVGKVEVSADMQSNSITTGYASVTSLSVKEGVSIGTGATINGALSCKSIDTRGSNIYLNGGMIYGGTISSSGYEMKTVGGSFTTSGGSINAGSGSVTCGSLTTQRGSITCGSLDCRSIDTNGYIIEAGTIYSNDKYVVVANGNSNSEYVKGLAIKTGSTSKYLEIQTWNLTAYGVNVWTSDINLKENIELIETSKVKLSETNNKIGLEAVLAIDHYKFDYKDSNLNHVDCGYIAQQLIEVNKNFAYNVKQEDGTDMYCPDISALIPTLSLAIKQQQEYIKALEERIKLLEGA